MNEASRGWDDEIERGERFDFGKNWASFLHLLNDDRIASAEASLKDMLGAGRLDGKRFLDAGSGSGLFSLAARRLRATVVSFDYDPQSVACTAELKRRYLPDDSDWQVGQGSVLDADFLGGLGTFDIVYSWGVLHHTGAMWQALENVAPLVAPGGQLFISIYNDQGRSSRTWTRVKRAYVRAPAPLKGLILGLALVRLWGPAAVRKLLGGGLRSLQPGKQPQPRGMDLWHDAKDWVGGYPFEVARPEQIFDFYRDRGFELERMKTCAGGLGCNEYVFRRGAA
jgi:2-polyprenyl-3-methyl-5-hydroxy-6-metoxy-1,4-benzoquinol methylase